MKKLVITAIIIIIAIGGFFYFRQQVYFSHGDFDGTKIFKIEKGQGNGEVVSNLEKEKLIAGEFYFYYYLQSRSLVNKIMPGEYELGGAMSIPEIAAKITNPEDDTVKITFPEGWTNKDVELRIKNYELSVDNFDSLVDNPKYFQEKYNYEFLNNLPKGATLEGFLFPDTYFYKKDAAAEDIIKKMLDNFGDKISPELKAEIKKQNKALFEIIIMASIIENEVRSVEDRALVSGIYWNRLKSGQPLQSDITLAYVLGEKKKQYSVDDTRTVSLYNTYLNKGLPPGPICNPGLSAIKAAIYPKDSDYNYYLSDPETGATIFSKTFEEHKMNKIKYGL